MINPANVHHFSWIEASLKGNPANMQEFLTFSSKKKINTHKSCIIAGYCFYRDKIRKNDVFLHHF